MKMDFSCLAVCCVGQKIGLAQGRNRHCSSAAKKLENEKNSEHRMEKKES